MLQKTVKVLHDNCPNLSIMFGTESCPISNAVTLNLLIRFPGYLELLAAGAGVITCTIGVFWSPYRLFNIQYWNLFFSLNNPNCAK